MILFTSNYVFLLLITKLIFVYIINRLQIIGFMKITQSVILSFPRKINHYATQEALFDRNSQLILIFHSLYSTVLYMHNSILGYIDVSAFRLCIVLKKTRA